MSLIARHFEAEGMPTAILGSAIDIVEHCGVPRFLFTDFPLGNPCGKPFDRAMQREIVSAGLELFETATNARTTVKTPYQWGSYLWRERYLQVTEEDRIQLQILGEERRAQREAQRQSGKVRKE